MARASSQHSSEYSSSMAATAHTCTHFGGERVSGSLKNQPLAEERPTEAVGEEKSANPPIRSAERNNTSILNKGAPGVIPL